MRAGRAGAAGTPGAAAPKRGRPQLAVAEVDREMLVEVPDAEASAVAAAVEGVVLRPTLPVTDACVPNTMLMMVAVAVATPPETASSSSSVSSVTNSTRVLPRRLASTRGRG